MAVVGFDVGNSSCYIAVARGGGIETIANEYSDRLTPTIVSFGENMRIVGSAAKSQVISNYKNTVTNFKRLIGRQYDDPRTQAELPRMNTEIVKRPDGGIGIKVQYMNEKETFSPEQIYSMLLTKLRMTAEANLNTKVVDCVLSVPQYYTDVERKSLLNAATIAGMNCLRIINDTTAAALAYGIYKQDLPTPEEKPRVVVFVDMGQSSLQVAVCAFNKGKLKVLNAASDPSVGGRDFDHVLAEHFADEFQTKYHIDVRSNVRAYVRLTQECEKLKKLMGSNATEIPLNIESIMNDRDVTGRTKRADFEAMASSLLKRVEATLKLVQSQIRLKPDDIYAIEIIGGSTRVPAVKELIKKVFKKEASTTLNQDEAVARGCALQCAILSPTFRVREFNVTDLTPYSISLLWKAAEGEEGEMEVFPVNHHVPFSKMLTFYRTEPFILAAKYTASDKIPHSDPFIGQFEIKNVKPTAEGESSKVKVKVRVNGHGIFKVSSASLMEKLIQPEQNDKDVTDKPNVANDKSDAKTANDGDEAAMETEETAANENSGEEEKKENGDVYGDDTQQTNESQSDEKKTDSNGSSEPVDAEDKSEPKKAKKTVRYHDIPVEEKIHGMSPKDIMNFVEKEGRMIAQDKLERERSDAKNSVEEYVYEMKDKLSSHLEQFIASSDRDKFLGVLDETENWLYDDGEDETKSVYVDKLAKLKKTGDPIEECHKESLERPQAFEDLGTCLIRYGKALAQYAEGDEKYSHLEKAEIEKVEKWVGEKEAWRDSKLNAQNQLAPHNKPIVLVSDIRSETASLRSNCDGILNKPKPKPKEEPPKDTEAKPETNDAKTDETMETTEPSTEAANAPSKEAGGGPDVDMELD